MLEIFAGLASANRTESGAYWRMAVFGVTTTVSSLAAPIIDFTEMTTSLASGFGVTTEPEDPRRAQS